MKKLFKITCTVVAGLAVAAMFTTTGCKKGGPIITTGPKSKDSLLIILEGFCSKTDSVGACNGVIKSFVKGGKAPYSYAWSTGATTKDISGVCPGSYTVTITDSLGKKTTAIGKVALCKDGKNCNDSIPSIKIKSKCNEKDSSGCTGRADADVHGGAKPYTYNWSNGSTDDKVKGLCAGTYTLTVTDAKGKTASQVVTIADCVTPALHLYTNDKCTSDSTGSGCDGQAGVSAKGGKYPYTYSWSNGATTAYVKNLCAGTYTVTVTDANGATESKVVTISVCKLPPLVVKAEGSCSKDTSGAGCNGTVVAKSYGGKAPYSYSWNTGATTNVVNKLCPGTYTVTVTDAKGGTATQTATVKKCK